MKETIVWSKDACPYCDMAKELLVGAGIPFEERNLSKDWSKEQLLEVVPDAKTVPQIFLYGEYIGGYTELQKYYEDHNMVLGNPKV